MNIIYKYTCITNSHCQQLDKAYFDFIGCPRAMPKRRQLLKSKVGENSSKILCFNCKPCYRSSGGTPVFLKKSSVGRVCPVVDYALMENQRGLLHRRHSARGVNALKWRQAPKRTCHVPLTD